MNEYRLSVDDDELDDYEEGAEMSVDDELGEYGIDEEDEDDLPVPAIAGIIPPAAKKKAAHKKAAPKKAAKRAAPRKAAKKAAPRKSAKKAAPKKKAAKRKK